MVKDDVRSFFLNELDGLVSFLGTFSVLIMALIDFSCRLSQAQNDGILTIATTNHPERIDDAILNRPSRFDVKYNFKLPDAALRTEFTLKWLEKVRALGASTGVSIEDPEKLANTISEKTEGWSFAFLKEL